MSLRMQYLLHIVSSAVTSGCEFVLTDATKEQLDFSSLLPQKLKGHKDFLTSFDNILSSRDWGVKWAEVLQQSASETDVVKHVKRLTPAMQVQGGQGEVSGKGAGANDERASLLESLRAISKVAEGQKPCAKAKTLKPDEEAGNQKGWTGVVLSCVVLAVCE